MTTIFKTSKEWYANCPITILDADGWDRSNFDYSFNKELITYEEFSKRLMRSTVEMNVRSVNKGNDRQRLR